MEQPQEFERKIDVSWKMIIYLVAVGAIGGYFYARIEASDVRMVEEVGGLRNDVEHYVHELERRIEKLEE